MKKGALFILFLIVGAMACNEQKNDLVFPATIFTIQEENNGCFMGARKLNVPDRHLVISSKVSVEECTSYKVGDKVLVVITPDYSQIEFRKLEPNYLP